MHRYHSMRFVSVTRPQVIFNGLFSSTNRCGFLLIKSTFPNYCVVRSYITTHKMHVFTVVHLVGNVCQWHAADIQWMPWKHWFSTLPVLHIFDPSLHEANLLEIFVIHKLFRVCLGWVLLEFSKICRAWQGECTELWWGKSADINRFVEQRGGFGSLQIYTSMSAS